MQAQVIKQKIWEFGGYYQLAKRGSKDLRHPGMKLLKRLALVSDKILDLGCGEGTRLNMIAKGKYGTGVDISELAISMAKKNYKNFEFFFGNLERLDFVNDFFDLTYSAYVLEHTINPELIIREAVRVTKKGGNIVFIAPNYGAPNRSSPVSTYNRYEKFFKGFLHDLFRVFDFSDSLYWNKVEPIKDGYFPDSDTTVEPYLLSLVEFLNKNGAKVIEHDSCWSEELPKASIYQRIFSLFARVGVYPFVYYGPHLVVHAVKI